MDNFQSEREMQDRIAILIRQIDAGNLPYMMYMNKLMVLVEQLNLIGDFELCDEYASTLIADGTDILSHLTLKSEQFKVADYVRRGYFTRGARHFEDYMIACEWYRVPNARFYLPRRKVLEGQHHLVSRIDKFISSPTEKMISLSMPPGTGKLLADDTPVLTTRGWKKHGELKVGDSVFAPDGKAVKVTHVFPKDVANVCVEFTNGEKIICHENHEWLIHNRTNWHDEIVETKFFLQRKLDTGAEVGRGHRYSYQLLNRTPIEGRYKCLHVKPYTMGAWLGDGQTKGGYICSAQDNLDVIQGVLDDGYEMSAAWRHKDTGVLYFSFCGLRNGLQKYGMGHSRRIVEKRIPEVYLTASLSQRLELLAGLLDTDGSLVVSKNEYRFTTSGELLRDTFCELLATFGWRYTVTAVAPHTSSSGVMGKHEYYTVRFCPTMYIPCRLKHKQLHVFSKQRRIAVKSCKYVEPVQGNCISVEGGLYCVGKQMIPTHNSTIIKFLLSFIAGRFPLSMNMYVSYADGMVEMVMDGVEAILTDVTEYAHNQIFPTPPREVSISKANHNISYRRKGDFPTIGFVSVGGSVTGRTRANKFLVTDDLVKNKEQARSRERMERLNDDYRATLTTRMIGKDVKQIMLGTIWCAQDPISVQMRAHEGEAGYTFIRIPVENENGESNFLYEHPDNYTKEKIEEARNSLDPVDFQCLMMQNPVERLGRLFPEEGLRYYMGELPSGEPDAIVAFIDVAWGGGDSLSMPIGYIYGDDVYIHAVIFDQGAKDITRPRVASAILTHNVQITDVEANNGGDEYAEDIQQIIKELTGGYPCSIRFTKAPSNTAKAVRIEQQAPVIRNFYFRHKSCRDKEYNAFMRELCDYNVLVKVPHDDAPDSCAGLANLILHTLHNSHVTQMKRPF